MLFTNHHLLKPLFFFVAASRKRHHTEEEMALKKSEITRRRKNQSAQRAEQDKLETINRLLKKQAGKRKKGAQDEDDGGDDKKSNDVDGGEGSGSGSGSGSRMNRFMTPSSYIRIRYAVDGTTLSIPEESLEDVPAWIQKSIPPLTPRAELLKLDAKGQAHFPATGVNRGPVSIEVLETPVVPLKEPSYPSPKGTCEVSHCPQPWKYRGIKSKKVACGLDHLKLVEAEA
jgi:hypothetical protein